MNSSRSDLVTVVGGGIMGRGIAVALASAGHTVTIVDTNTAVAASLRHHILALVGEFVTDPHTVEKTLDLITINEKLDDSVRSAGLVVEAITENFDVKQELWQHIGNVAPTDSILATNTSALNIDSFAAEVPAPERFLGTHWFNPATLIPCVEVVRGAATSDAVVDRVCSILSAAGKEPIVVRNSPGFVANRIQFALIREAMLCLEEGLATAEDIDMIVSSSFGPRLAVLGPLANADLGGLDTYRSILNFLSSEFDERFAVPRLLDDLVSEGRTGTKALGGIYKYTEESAQNLINYRDASLRRVINAAATETGEVT